MIIESTVERTIKGRCRVEVLTINQAQRIY